MDTAGAERAGAVVDGSAALPLVRAAAVLRWSRPDLTATLAELALEAAPDAGTWVAAAGWLLHGRATLGDGRDTACALLDGLDRWGEPAVALLDGPVGRRLRVELAGPARRIGETSIARALLASAHDADKTDEGDRELRADVLTELARCAVDDAPDAVEDALSAAEAAWRAVGSAPGVASVTLLRAARSRRSARPDAAVTEAVDGLVTVNVRGRRSGATASDHVAAALTAEWIAALVDAGRLDEARGEGLAAANRLVATARPSRQVAGLRLAIARVTAVDESPDAVLAALEPAAQVATDSDVPELESACRSMLGELHEAAGRLDAALAAVRVAMSAERRDRERVAQLRARLAAAATTWAGGRGPAGKGHGAALGTPSGGPGGSREQERMSSVPGDVRNDPPAPGGPTGRRARRLAAEASENGAGGISAAAANGDLRSGAGSPGHDNASAAGRVPHTDRVARSAPAVDAGGARHDAGSLIGDALLRELAASGRAAPDDKLPTVRGAVARGRVGGDRPARGTGGAEADPLFGPSTASRGPDLPRLSGAAPNGSAPGSDHGSVRRPAPDARPVDGRGPDGHAADSHAVDPRMVDAQTVRWGRLSPIEDTVVLGVREGEQADRNGRPAADPSGASGPTHAVNGSTSDARPPSNAAGTNGVRADPPHSNGSAPHPPQNGTPARDPATPTGTPDTTNGAQPARRGASGRAPGRPPSTDTDGLGLADLLAGALAAYRDL